MFLFFLDVPVCHHCCVPFFRCSCFPVFLFSSVLVFQCSCFQMFLFSSVPVINCSWFQLLLYSDVPVFHSSCFPLYLFSFVLVFRCSCFPVFLFSSVPDFRFSCFQMFLFPVFLFLCSCCLNAEARRSRFVLMVLKRLHRGVTSGRRPGIVWSIATFRYALTIRDRTETPGIPRLVP